MRFVPGGGGATRLLQRAAFAAWAAALIACGSPPERMPDEVLRVCADPNNLPFSNEAREGFENRLAELIAADMDAAVEYTWWAQRRGFVRNTVRAGRCDVVPGVPADYELLATTRPYYRGQYVFLSRADRSVALRGLDDEQIAALRVGVHLIGDDYGSPPPVHALARRGIVQNVTGYSLFGDYAAPNPPARLVDAVVRGDVDVAIVWGPLAGYFAERQPVPMHIDPVPADPAFPFLPFEFDIAVGVSRERPDLLERIDAILERRAAEIDRLLDEFGAR